MMKLDRNKISIKKGKQDDNNYVHASPSKRVSFMWELTAELWSLRGAKYVKQRLPRNVTNLKRK